eukprot:516273-Amphidinium_carterae.1
MMLSLPCYSYNGLNVWMSTQISASEEFHPSIAHFEQNIRKNDTFQSLWCELGRVAEYSRLRKEKRARTNIIFNVTETVDFEHQLCRGGTYGAENHIRADAKKRAHLSFVRHGHLTGKRCMAC